MSDLEAVQSVEVAGPFSVEEALRIRERQLAETQRLADVGSWVWDVAADKVTWTDELYRMYGLDRDSFPATFAGYLERVHPDDRAAVRRQVEEAFRAGGDFGFEERIVRPDGEIRVLRSRGQAVVDGNGRTTRLTGACLDITDMKAAEAQAIQLAREQAARNEAETTVAGLGFLVRASEVLASDLDYEATLRNVSELAASQFADWCAIDLVRGETIERVAVVHQDPTKVSLARQYMQAYPPDPDGRTGPWKVIRSGAGELIRDIPDDLLSVTARDARQLAMLRELGLRSAITVPLIGRSGTLGVLTLVQANSERRFSDADFIIAQQLGRHAGLAIENAGLHRDLEYRHDQLAAVTAELEQQTEELQVQATQMEDLMAELQSVNEELQDRTDAAEEANRVKAGFLATMSHELRTPLNAIAGYADLMEMELHGPITDAQRGALGRIKRNQLALLTLVNDVLNFARIEAGKLEFAMSDIAVQEILCGVEAVLAPRIAANGLRCEFADVGPLLRVRADAERVEQILSNLLTNAIKFTTAGGQITVAARVLDGKVHLSVSDTGCGIPADRLAAIFDPFVQLDRSSVKPDDRGVGLGLSISRNLAIGMGGELTAASEVGKGSVFTLVLTAAE